MGGLLVHISEQFNTYYLAYRLVQQDKFQILHMDANHDELWLNKNDQKSSLIIRIIQQGFNWKNHLKKDIASVFQRVDNMNHVFNRKNIQIYNIYVTEFPPVDDWEALKKPLLLNSKKSLYMNIFYLSQQQFTEEYGRLLNKLNSTIDDEYQLPSEQDQMKWMTIYKQRLSNLLSANKKRISSIINFGTPRITYIIILINIFMFLAMLSVDSSIQIDTLIKFGAKENSLIINGEWWRIVSATILHIGFIHLIINMFALYYLGSAVEKTFGNIRFFIIYLTSGIGGSIASFAFHTNVSAGASGALFGLFGALLFFTIIYKSLFFKTMGGNLLLILLINIIFGMAIPLIDIGAHLGGLVTGFIVAGAIYVPNKKNIIIQAISIFIILSACLMIFFKAIT